MTKRLQELNKHLKNYSSDMYAGVNLKGSIDILRKRSRFDGPYNVDGVSLLACVDNPEYVFSLTTNWNQTGESLPWGWEVIRARLEAHDLTKNPGLIEELLAMPEKREQEKSKQFSNTVEEFLYEFRDDFKKAFNDVRTCNMNTKY